MFKLNFEGPINNLSLGNVTVNFLRELVNKDVDLNLFPVGDKAEFAAYDNLETDVRDKIIKAAQNRFSNYDSKNPVLRLWHINGSQNRVASDQYLYTFYEVTEPTETEISIVKSQKHVFFSSEFASNLFKSKGCENVSYVPLGFDKDFLHAPERKVNALHFGLIGKFEKRKNTERIIKLWTSLYGDDPNYQLSLLVNNPFYKPEDFQKVLQSALGKKWNNVNILPPLTTNTEVAALHKSIDIDLSACCGSEGWNLPSFNSCCLGKICVVGNATGHKGWANEKNSILIEPEGLEPCYDNVFFREGAFFNQGDFYTFSDEEIIRGIKAAVKKSENTEGKIRQKMIDRFSYSDTIDKILAKIKS